jgi:hypothetical protein
MRNIAICLIVILCSWVTALGQSGVPQWKVVQTLKLANQTAEISGATLFTPTTSVGMYRVALYISCGPTAVGDGTFDAYVNWEVGGYKKAGGLSLSGPPIFAYCASSVSQVGAGSQTAVINPRAGVPIAYSVYPAGPNPQESYDLVIVVEQLQ